MRDDSLIEPFAVQEIFVDGFSQHVIHRGVMSCVGYRYHPAPNGSEEPTKVVVIRLVWPAASTDEAITDARQAQATPIESEPKQRARRH